MNNICNVCTFSTSEKQIDPPSTTPRPPTNLPPQSPPPPAPSPPPTAAAYQIILYTWLDLKEFKSYDITGFKDLVVRQFANFGAG